MNGAHTVRSDTKRRRSSHGRTRLWNLPAYGKPLRNAPSHRPWKTPPIHRPRFPQLPQPLPPEEKKPEQDKESGSHHQPDSHIVWYENRGHVIANTFSNPGCGTWAVAFATARRTSHFAWT